MTALIRLLTSTPFRLTLAYMGAFVVAAVTLRSRPTPEPVSLEVEPELAEAA